jgi:hypothetical protein
MTLLLAAVLAQTVTGPDPAYLRSGAEREWAGSPQQAAPALQVNFEAAPNAREHTLVLRQRDVKSAAWKVRINNRDIGALNADERDMRQAYSIPAGVLTGANTLDVACAGCAFSDDIELREIRIVPIPRDEWLSQSRVAVDAGALPLRITVVDSAGVLVPLKSLGNPGREAVRTGVVYTADGSTTIGLPAGGYRIFASRGFEYSAPSKSVRLKTGDSRRIKLRLKKEVELDGYASLDTHVHTLELSGHGDATVRERIITAAGEGLDVIAVTEHNRIADYVPTLRQLGLEKHLTVIPGNEVTTAMGHFNIFPVRLDAPPPDWRTTDWTALSASLQASVVIQNHPRDLHSNYRPFDPAHHRSETGENLNGRPVFANAVEVINSGAMSSDILQPVLDWLGLLNAGLHVAAIGASDTHTVDFVPIGQARTYVPRTSVPRFENFGRTPTLVSYGLVARIISTAPHEHGLDIDVEVLAPSWSAADHVAIYANRTLAAERRIAGSRWRGAITIPKQDRDAIVVAVATGPGVLQPFWEVRKPYQPTSKIWTPKVAGISNPIRVPTTP